MSNLIVKGGAITAIFIVWFYTFFQGITTAVNIWSISEIFNHCFLVIPGALFLIYQKRTSLHQQPIVANYWLLCPLMGVLILYTFGYVGDIRLFMHVATFTSLPLLIWFFIGNKAAKVIAFPLYFMVFSIPFGEQLIPYLQEITTDLAVPLLELTGIPVYRNGLYLEIPEGRFLVAEACSGISFLISSIVFGHIYAYISFKTLPKRLLFIFISLVLPIIANAIRVYGIVLIAHLTDMEYAVGADHLIYGGVFFAIVLFLLILVGEQFRDKIEIMSTQKPVVKEGNSKSITSMINKPWMSFFPIIILFLIQNFWLSTVVNNKQSLADSALMVDLSALPLVVQEGKSQQWQPQFSQASSIQQGYLKGSSSQDNIDFFIATYFGGEGELISAANKLYSADRWTLISNVAIRLDGDNKAQLIKVVSPTGRYRYILYWYQFSNELFTNKVKLKLYQTWIAMLGQKQKSAIIAFSIESDEKIETVLSMLQPNVNIIQTNVIQDNVKEPSL